MAPPWLRVYFISLDAGLRDVLMLFIRLMAVCADWRKHVGGQQVREGRAHTQTFRVIHASFLLTQDVLL